MTTLNLSGDAFAVLSPRTPKRWVWMQEAATVTDLGAAEPRAHLREDDAIRLINDTFGMEYADIAVADETARALISDITECASRLTQARLALLSNKVLEDIADAMSEIDAAVTYARLGDGPITDDEIAHQARANMDRLQD